MAELVRLVINERALARFLISEPLAQDMTRRSQRVAGRSKDLCPVDTGRLRSSIDYRVLITPAGLEGRVGTNVWYAELVHNGTKAHVIERTGPMYNANGRVRTLRFPSGGGGRAFTYRRMVNHPGTRAVPFLRDALPAAA